MSQELPKVVQKDSEVEIQFSLSLMDETLVESSQPDKNFCFKIGDGTFLPALENLLIGLEVGIQGVFQVPPEEAFGYAQPENIQTLPRTDFLADVTLKEGNVIGFNTPTGDEVPGTILSFNDKTVEVDFNHPLAGQYLIFDATIMKIL